MENSENNKIGFSLSMSLNIGMGLLFLLTALFISYKVRQEMRHYALNNAEVKAMILLDRSLATHRYFSEQLKPSVFSLTDAFRPAEYFDPCWMSSTYAVREIDKYFNEIGGNYYYKECAINARSPENEADATEAAFLQELNQDPGLTVRSGVRKIDGELYYETIRRGETLDESCLRCHDTPDRAPAGLVEVYGPERSFDRRAGEVVSAVSIRVPLATAYAEADQLAGGLLLVLLAAFLVFLYGQFLLHRQLVGTPLKRIQEKALQIAEDDTRLGEEIPLPYVRELNLLTRAFNRMAARLRASIGNLEQQVSDRTVKLTAANRKLEEEIVERHKLQQEQARVIEDLREAIAEIKTLRGIIPICSYCKEIRDDKGAWKRIEEYIALHSEAEFSHGICPKCAHTHYPDYFKKEE